MILGYRKVELNTIRSSGHPVSNQVELPGCS